LIINTFLWFKVNIACPYCYDTLSAEKRQRVAERAKQMELAKAHGEVHLGG
jgi:UPF0176 protein